MLNRALLTARKSCSTVMNMTILRSSLIGRNLDFTTLQEAISQPAHMLIFPRHLGCNLSLKLIQDIKELEGRTGRKLPITFVSQGSKNFCDRFWASRHAEARVIYDINLQIARSFGLREGTLLQVANPQAVFCYIKALSGGFVPTGPKGNVFMLPGVFVYQNGRNVIQHIASHAGDLPDFENMVKSHLLRVSPPV